MYIWIYVRYPLFLSDYFNLKFLDGFSKNTQETNFMKILPAGLQLFHADEQRTEIDMAKFIIAFCNFVEARKAAVSSSQNLSAGALANSST